MVWRWIWRAHTRSTVRSPRLQSHWACRTTIDKLEQVQRSFTKRLQGLKELSYNERLRQLNLQRLELRRLHLDLVFVYKMIHGLVDLRFEDYFSFRQSKTRGHKYTLNVNRAFKDVRKFFFSNRVVKWWNSLSAKTISATTINSFKSRLYDEVHLNGFLKGGGD
jgi:hypothetical protein